MSDYVASMTAIAVWRFSLLSCILSLPVDVVAAQIPRMRNAVWILNHYLSDRHTLTGASPDVLVCADGIPGEWRSGIESWVPSSREAHSSSIAMRESCPEGPGGLDTLYVREITPVVDSLLGYVRADLRYNGNREIRRHEDYGAAPTMMFRFSVVFERADSVFRMPTRPASAAEAVWRYLTVRGHVLGDQRGRWVVICEPRVAVSEVNKYVAEALRYYRLPVTLDHGCQIPAAVQEDTTRFVLMVDRVELADTAVMVTSRRLSAHRIGRPRTETFRLFPNGDAQLLLHRFIYRPPH